MHTKMATTLSAAPSALAIRSLPSFPTTTTTIIFDDEDDGKDEEEEMHEFVVIYEGPPSPRQRRGGDYDDLGKNRQVLCLSLPPTGGGCASTCGGTSYVSECDLLASIAARIGWPASFLCISQPASSHRSSSSPPPLFFPAHSITTSDVVVIRRRHHQHPPLRATIVPRLSSVRGGKGGFGTLLRGQSKQAGARTTVDFGACRDLSGRRLRHVNDEIKLRRWRELRQAAGGRRGKDGGGDAAATAAELAALRTPSGIRNWHLAVPGWSEHGGSGSTNKGRRKVERQLENEARGWKAREDRVREERESRKLEGERAVEEYVRRMEVEGGRVGTSASSGVKEGILNHYRNKRGEKGGRKRGDGSGGGGGGDPPAGTMSATAVADDGEVAARSAVGDAAAKDDPPSAATVARYLMTLSGEMSAFDLPLDDDVDHDREGGGSGSRTMTTNTATATATTRLRIQSQSDFATAVVLLDSEKTRDMRGRVGVYVEYTIRTAGLAQIGWVRVGLGGDASGGGGAFLPNSDTGDGVGDDAASYGYDGSRGLKFHGGEEVSYGSSSAWKAGDVVGCYCKFSEKEVGEEEEEDAVAGRRNECIVEIGYSLNGTDLGRAHAFTNILAYGGGGEAFPFYPAVSLNLNEVVDVNIGPDFAYRDSGGGCAGACELVGTGKTIDAGDDDAGDGDDDGGNGSGPTEAEMIPPKKRLRDESLTGQSPAANEIVDAAKKVNDVKPSKPTANSDVFDLNKCSSVVELEDLGPERLKGIMLSMGVKCG